MGLSHSGFLGCILSFASLALGFGAIFVLGEARHRWAMWPATVFAILAATLFATSDPYRFDPAFAQVRMLWPIVLIGGGVWLLHREERLR